MNVFLQAAHLTVLEVLTEPLTTELAGPESALPHMLQIPL